MLCTHHVGPCWQGMTVPEGVSVQVATDGLLVSPSRPVAAGWAVVPPPLPGVSAPTTQKPCESYSWHDAGSAEAITAEAPTHSSATANARAIRRTTAPACSKPCSLATTTGRDNAGSPPSAARRGTAVGRQERSSARWHQPRPPG